MAAILGTACMCAFYIVYRKMMFPSFFGGEIRKRWGAIPCGAESRARSREVTLDVSDVSCLEYRRWTSSFLGLVAQPDAR